MSDGSATANENSGGCGVDSVVGVAAGVELLVGTAWVDVPDGVICGDGELVAVLVAVAVEIGVLEPATIGVGVRVAVGTAVGVLVGVAKVFGRMVVDLTSLRPSYLAVTSTSVSAPTDPAETWMVDEEVPGAIGIGPGNGKTPGRLLVRNATIPLEGAGPLSRTVIDPVPPLRR